jgi:hypothetical protein
VTGLEHNASITYRSELPGNLVFEFTMTVQSQDEGTLLTREAKAIEGPLLLSLLINNLIGPMNERKYLKVIKAGLEESQELASCGNTGCAEGRSHFAGSLRVSLRYFSFPLPDQACRERVEGKGARGMVEGFTTPPARLDGPWFPKPLIDSLIAPINEDKYLEQACNWPLLRDEPRHHAVLRALDVVLRRRTGPRRVLRQPPMNSGSRGGGAP